MSGGASTNFTVSLRKNGATIGSIVSFNISSDTKILVTISVPRTKFSRGDILSLRFEISDGDGAIDFSDVKPTILNVPYEINV